jgi:hypothetical protein
MTRRRLLKCLTFVVAIAAIAITVGVARSRSLPFLVNESGLRTVAATVPKSCDVTPDGVRSVAGWLEGDPLDPERVWLRQRSTDRRLSVVWPAGFKVAFDDEPGLITDEGWRYPFGVSQAFLMGVDVRSHAGTFEDPYVVTGSTELSKPENLASVWCY